MSDFDAIVVGAGNAGLMAAAVLAKNGKKPLVLERHNIPGGSATSFRRGRFEFETSLHELCRVGTEEAPNEIRNAFKNVDADVDWHNEKELFRLVVPKKDIDISLPTEVMPLIQAMEKAVPGSGKPTADWLTSGKEAGEAIGFLSSGGNPQELPVKYPNFLRMAGTNIDEGFDALGMPEEAKEILSTYWAYLGANAKQMDMLFYTVMFLGYLIGGPAMPDKRSHELSLALVESIRDHGGQVWFNSEAEKFIVEDGQVKGVVVNGEEIPCSHVISNAFPNYAFSEKMMDKDEIPEKAVRAANARKIALELATIYLGLDCTPEELGIEHYSNFIEDTTDSVAIADNSKTIKFGGYEIVNCLNLAVPNASPEGTCQLFLTTLYYDSPWKDLKPEEYRKAKIDLARDMIDRAEQALGFDIYPHIEEIEIATPVTFARYLNTPEGTPYGYQLDMDDSFLIRLVNGTGTKQQFVKGLRFAGAHAERGDGYSSAYMTGQSAALETLKDMQAEKAEKEEEHA